MLPICQDACFLSCFWVLLDSLIVCRGLRGVVRLDFHASAVRTRFFHLAPLDHSHCHSLFACVFYDWLNRWVRYRTVFPVQSQPRPYCFSSLVICVTILWSYQICSWYGIYAYKRSKHAGLDDLNDCVVCVNLGLLYCI